jgi:putative ABC transport system substrate-binding protein
MPVIGFLHPGSPEARPEQVAGFRRALGEAGFSEGQNVIVEYRWAHGHYERLPELVADFVRRQVRVIAATGGDPSVMAAKASTTTIPIVFDTSSDPVRLGLVVSLGRPGGNITGVSLLTSELSAKRLELIRELAPAAAIIVILVNPDNPGAEANTKDALEAARTLGRQLHILKARNNADLDGAFPEVAKAKAQALIVLSDPFFNSRAPQLVALSARHRLPAIYSFREYAAVGGLISYAPSLADAYRQVGFYVGRILSGENPAELPVVQATKFELVINLRAAKDLGLTVPPTLLARADEVIE